MPSLLKMMLCVLLLAFSSPAAAQTTDKCASIENAGARLSCYNPRPEQPASGASDQTKAAVCLLNFDKVGMLYNGAAPSSIEFHTGCKPILISRHGDGMQAVKMFQIIDVRGSILVITANGDDRMTGYSYHHAP